MKRSVLVIAALFLTAAAFAEIPMREGKEWCSIRLLQPPKPGEKVVLSVRYQLGEEKGRLACDLHWHDREGKPRGFLAASTRKAPEVTGSGEEIFEITLPEREDMRGFLAVVYLSPDGSFKGRSRLASTQLVRLEPVLPQAEPPVFDPAAETRSWRFPHAKVLPHGDLEWAPEPFRFRPEGELRYIDFERGDDRNSGRDRNSPWKHHPWDAAATGNAAGDATGDTFVFRRGVVYRGVLEAKRSGTPARPLRLTSDPAWGEGRAVLSGAERVSGVWKRNGKIWSLTLPAGTPPRTVWEIADGETRPLILARTPNWRFDDPDDIRAGWFVWQSASREKGAPAVTGRDPVNLKGLDPKSLAGALVHSEYYGLIGYPEHGRVVSLDAGKGELIFQFPTYRAAPVTDNRYYLEDALAFLDEPGEFFYDAAANRLYLRLPGDRDPNRAVIEIGRETRAVILTDRSDIEISGLAFRRFNEDVPGRPTWSWNGQPPACVVLNGDCRRITVANCEFIHVAAAVCGGAKSSARQGACLDRISIRDNDIRFAADHGVSLGDGGRDQEDGAPWIFRVEVLRNRIRDTGLRSHSFGNAVKISHARVGEVAGNIIERTGGSGIVVYVGKNGWITEDGRDVPFCRFFIHHNKVADPLLLLNDYGGIETWQGGPTYVYNNLSLNPGGYRHYYRRWAADRNETRNMKSYTTGRFGFAYYLDGGFKNYLFNNIAAGKNGMPGDPRCNSAGLMQVHGYNNSFFHNTFYRFGAGSRQQFSVQSQSVNEDRMPGLTAYLANLWLDAGDCFFSHDAWLPNPRDLEKSPIDYTTIAFARNVFAGKPRTFGTLEYGHGDYPDLVSFRRALEKRKTEVSSLGTMSAQNPLTAPAAGDFRPKAATGEPVRHFVPWSLYGTVGEWHFRRYPDPANPRIPDESCYLNREHRHRFMYRFIPRADLQCVGVTPQDFTAGVLEDWTEGALRFNGKNYAFLPMTELLRDGDYTLKKSGAFHFAAGERPTVDMAGNNFLVEAVFRTEAGHTGGLLAAKITEGRGYRLGIDAAGCAYLELGFDGTFCRVASSRPVNGGGWIHLVAEADRRNGRLLLSLDGKRDAEAALPPGSASLANPADFRVGEGLRGDLDFLRVARGTLVDAFTTIGELYDWQFNGPFLGDFTGRERRDAGALSR